MKVLVIEDEGVAARRISKMATELGLEVVGICKSIKAIEKHLSESEEPDLYLSDIHLSDGLIFDFLEANPIIAPIIFTTAYDKYAIKAFKANSIDYLLKPIEREELKIAVEKLKSKLQTSTKLDILELKQMLKSTQTKKSNRSRISVTIGDKLRSVAMADVMLIYSQDKTNYILTNEKRSYPIDMKIDELLEDLDESKFFKINRGAVVSIDYIKEVVVYSNSRLKINLSINNSQELIVARDRVKEFKNWF